jgi:hypothetical protein
MTAPGVSGPTLSKGLRGRVQGVRLVQLNPPRLVSTPWVEHNGQDCGAYLIVFLPEIST